MAESSAQPLPVAIEARYHGVMAWTLCLNTSTIKPQPLLEKVRLSAEAGFEAIELWINDVYEFVGRGGEVRDLEKALADSGLRVPCMIALKGWGDASEEEYPQALEEVKRRMELCARLGSPYVVTTPPRSPCPVDQVTRRYGDVLAIGRAVGVTPTFEYLSFSRSVSRLDAAWQIVQDTGARDATLIVDAFHNWNSGSTCDDLSKIPGERVSHYHIDDAHPDKPPLTQLDPDRVMIGDGAIDLAAEIQVLRDIGYEGAISLELFNEELWAQDPRDVLRLGLERMRALLET